MTARYTAAEVREEARRCESYGAGPEMTQADMLRDYAARLEDDANVLLQAAMVSKQAEKALAIGLEQGRHEVLVQVAQAMGNFETQPFCWLCESSVHKLTACVFFRAQQARAQEAGNG